MSLLREEILKVLNDSINRLVWQRGMSTTGIHRQVFNVKALQPGSTSLPDVRKELTAMETEGLVTGDRRMQNVIVWSLV